MIAVDILFDGVFAAVAAIGFGAISDPPVRAFPYIALLAAEGDFSSLPDISLAEDDTLTIGRKVYVAGYPYGMPFTITEGSVSSPKQLMDGKYYIQTDAAVNPGNSGGPAADGPGYLCLQDGLCPHHVSAIAQRSRAGPGIYAAVFSECHRVVQRDYPVGCGRHAADIHLQPPGFLAHTAQTEP